MQDSYYMLSTRGLRRNIVTRLYDQPSTQQANNIKMTSYRRWYQSEPICHVIKCSRISKHNIRAKYRYRLIGLRNTVQWIWAATDNIDTRTLISLYIYLKLNWPYAVKYTLCIVHLTIYTQCVRAACIFVRFMHYCLLLFWNDDLSGWLHCVSNILETSKLICRFIACYVDFITSSKYATSC